MSEYPIYPTSDFVLIAPVRMETQTPGGLSIAPNQSPYIDYGTVLADGAATDIYDSPSRAVFAESQMVIYKSDHAKTFQYKGSKLVLVEYSDILALVEA